LTHINGWRRLIDSKAGIGRFASCSFHDSGTVDRINRPSPSRFGGAFEE
jgi:hypothetical protein